MSQASNLSIAFRRAPRIGDLDPTVFCAPFVAAVIGDRFGPAVAFGRKPVGGDAVLREPRRHRLRPRFRKRLVIGVVADRGLGESEELSTEGTGEAGEAGERG